MQIDHYYDSIERNNIVLRELLTLTYNINTKKGQQKKSSQLLPFRLDEQARKFSAPFDEHKQRIEKAKLLHDKVLKLKKP